MMLLLMITRKSRTKSNIIGIKSYLIFPFLISPQRVAISDVKVSTVEVDTVVLTLDFPFARQNKILHDNQREQFSKRLTDAGQPP